MVEGFELKIDPIWKHKDVVGIDIGTRSVKCIQLRKFGKKISVVGFGQIPVPENFIIEGIVAEPEKLSEKIHEFLEKGITGKINAKRVYTSLPESKIFTRTISLPHGADKSIEEAVNFEATQTIPMAMSDLYLDWQVIGPSHADSKLDEVLYAAAPRAIVNSYVQLYSLLGLELAGIETSLTAIIRAIGTKKNAKEASLIIDIGGQTTNLAIFDNAIRVTGSTLVGGEQLTYQISQALGISEADAEKLKKKASDKQIEKTQAALSGAVTGIAKEAINMINYYEEKSLKKIKITKILLCGGSASLPSLSEVLTEKLAIPTQVVNNIENLVMSKNCEIPPEEVPTYVNAIGLAMLGVIDD
jgi:type IV pilus assembly protein PilM